MKKNPPPNKSELKFQKILAWLMTEVVYGRAHVTIVQGMRHAGRHVLGVAPMFFEMTLGAHADAAQMTAARIFDSDGDISIHTLISSALREAGSFKHGSAAQVRKLVDETRATIAALRPVVAAVQTRRHQTLAHAGSIPLIDPERYVSEGRMTFTEFSCLFDEVATVLNNFSLLCRGTRIDLHMAAAQDYERMFQVI